jgi:hypothetical protein
VSPAIYREPPNERCSSQALFGGALRAQLLDVLAAELGR